MPSPRPKILLVDDEANLLDALKRQLHQHFEIDTAQNGQDAIALFEWAGPYAVVVCDMRMPVMNGIECLRRARDICPQTIRMMLTGNSDQDTAMAAVNDGHIFRFHRKPIPAAELAGSILECCDEYDRRLDEAAQSQSIASRLNLANSEMEELRRFANAAEDSKSTFMAMMNHELRTPLNHVIGFAEALQSRSVDPLSQQADEYLEHISASGHALLSLLNRIFEVSRISSAGYSIEQDEFDPALLIEAAVEELKETAKAKGITISCDIKSAGKNVLGDKRLLRSAVSELVCNAVKFNCSGGRVFITADFPANAETLRIQVADTGMGMGAEDVKKALAPFQQIEDGLNRSFEGMGLGLTLAGLIAKLHGGELEITSKPAKGTAASLVVPIHQFATKVA